MGTPGCRTRQIPLVTTRLNPERYPVADLAEWCRPRGQIETSRAHLKTPMRREVWPCKTVPGVLKELTVWAIVDHLVRMVLGHSATRQRLSGERLSFRDALRWLGAPHTGMPLRVLIVNPIRPQRVEPRVKKWRPTSFP